MLNKGKVTVVPNENNDLILMRPMMSWHVCMDYKKLKFWTKNDHFLMSFMAQILDCLAGRG